MHSNRFLAGKRNWACCVYLQHTSWARPSLWQNTNNQVSSKTNHLLLSTLKLCSSTWRPLFDKVDDWPLALCDSRSVDLEADLIPSDSVFPDTVSETLQVFQNPEHKWFFLDGQKINEMLLFKIFDSDESVSRCKYLFSQILEEGVLTSTYSLQFVPMPLLNIAIYRRKTPRECWDQSCCILREIRRRIGTHLCTTGAILHFITISNALMQISNTKLCQSSIGIHRNTEFWYCDRVRHEVSTAH